MVFCRSVTGIPTAATCVMRVVLLIPCLRFLGIRKVRRRQAGKLIVRTPKTPGPDRLGVFVPGGRGRFRTADICLVRAALYP